MRMNVEGLLKPTQAEVERLALRETEPEHYKEFAPFERGPFFAVAVVIGVGLLSVLAVPARVLVRVLRGSL
jgi:hypothetical protein